MLPLLQLLLLLGGVFAEYKRICWYASWSQYRGNGGKFLPENIDPSVCTDIAYAMAKINGNALAAHDPADESGFYARVIALKSKNPKLRVWLGVGGWSLGSPPFEQVSRSAANRQAFASNAVSFLRQRGFDGLNVDWEHPSAAHKNDYTELLKELRIAFEKDAKTSKKEMLHLSVSLSAGGEQIQNSYDIPAMTKYIDHFLLMTYDYHGSWERSSGHNSPLYPRKEEQGWNRNLNLDWTVNEYMRKGAPANKIVVGLATYGRSFTLVNPNDNAIGSPVTGAGERGPISGEAGSLGYLEVCENIKNKKMFRGWNEDQKVPYAFGGNQWVGHDDPQSIKIKCEYVKSKGFAGVHVWAIDFDDFTGKCDAGTFPIMNTIKNVLGGGGGNVNFVPPPPPPVNPNPPSPPSGGPSPPGSNNNDNTGPATCAGKPNGDYAFPNTCTKFYKCVEGHLHETPCPPGLLYSRKDKICDWAANVKC